MLPSCQHVFFAIIVQNLMKLHLCVVQSCLVVFARAKGVSPGRGLQIPHGYLHPDKSEHSVTMVRRARVVISLISKIWLFIRSGRGKDEKKTCKKT